MDYIEFRKDFAQRTKYNLENYNGEYEATNLINSLLGMLVFVKEKEKTIVINKCLHDYQNDAHIQWLTGSVGWMEEWRDKTNPESIDNLVRHMRNAIAHCGIEPFSKGNSVKGFIFTDRRKNHALNESFDYWKLSLDLEAIRAIADDLVSYVLNENQ